MDKPLTAHPMAEFFPLIEGAEFDDLVSDIKEHGLQQPITVSAEGHILDGRNRYRACIAAGVKPIYSTFEGSGILAFIISQNLRRRHLNESQRAMVAAKLHAAGMPQRAAADMLQVSRRTAQHATQVVERGGPSLVNAVDRGTVAVSTAAEITADAPEAQAEVVAKGERAILAEAKRIRAEKTATRRAERVDRIVAIAKGNGPLPTDVRYPVIYADPPWRFEDPPMGDTDRSIENHYPTMPVDEIMAMPVGELAAPDALLFLWATVPNLPNALKVMEHWGFKYRSQLVWDKEVAGQGHYFRNQHEVLLVGRRGDMPPPAPEHRCPSIIREKKGEHSDKPDAVANWIGRAYAGVPKIELFCRGEREGWAVWGNQAGAPE